MKEKNFNIGETVIMHSPFSDQDTEMDYRGNMPDDKSVVYNPKTGMQLTVLTIWLRKKENDAPKRGKQNDI